MTDIERKVIRCFLAIVPNEKTLARLSSIIDRLRKKIKTKKIRWIKNENLHLTMRFIGKFETGKLDHLQQSIETSLQGFRSFNIAMSEPHLFPSAEKARVIAMRADPENELQSLAHVLEQAVVATGVPAETRPFRNHLTVARIMSPIVMDSEALMTDEVVDCLVEAVVLLQSITKESGVVYECLHKVAFI